MPCLYHFGAPQDIANRDIALDLYIAKCDVVSMSISFTPSALRQWTSLDPGVRKRIRTKIESFADSGIGDVKKLQGRAGSRLRVGDWRVIFYMEDTTLVVAAVGHRREIYD